MAPEHKDYRQEWEKRAAVHQDDRRGVLYGGLPAEINAAIDAWHAALVERNLLPGLPGGACILDLAAGYGRLSQVIAGRRQEVTLVGLDLSFTYNQLYARNAGSAVCGDMRSLPFRERAFDRVIAVTGLMYLDQAECEAAAREILARLKPGGLALFVDPGAEMIRMLRRVRPSLAQATTGGDGFTADDYPGMFTPFANCVVLAKGGNTFFTWMLPLLLLLGRRTAIAPALARWAVRLDLKFGGWSRLALHRWVLVRRDA